VVAPSPLWIPSTLNVKLDSETISGSVEADAGEFEILAGRIDELYSEIDPVSERLRNEPNEGNLMCSWTDEDDSIDNDDDDQVDDDDSDESWNERLFAPDVREIVDTHQEKQAKFITVCKERMNQTPTGEIIIKLSRTNVGKQGLRSDNDDNGKPISVICEAQTDQNHESIDIIEAQKVDGEKEVGTSINGNKCIAQHDACNNQIDGPHKAVNESELGKDLRQTDDEGETGSKHHELIVKKCETRRIYVGSERKIQTNDLHTQHHDALMMGDFKSMDAPKNKVSTSKMDERKSPVYNDYRKINHGTKSGGNASATTIVVECETQTDQACKHIEIIEAQKLGSERDNKYIAQHDACNNQICGPQTVIRASEPVTDPLQPNNERCTGKKHHNLIVKECKYDQIDIGSEGMTNIIDLRQLHHKKGIIVNRVRAKTREAPQNKVNTSGNMTEEMSPVYDYGCRISHVIKSAKEQCRNHKPFNLAVVLQATKDDSEGVIRCIEHYNKTMTKKTNLEYPMFPRKENKDDDERRANGNEEQCIARESGILDVAIGVQRSSPSHEYPQHRTIFCLPTMVPPSHLPNTDVKHEVNSKLTVGVNSIINQEVADCGTQTAPLSSRVIYHYTAVNDQSKLCNSSSNYCPTQ